MCGAVGGGYVVVVVLADVGMGAGTRPPQPPPPPPLRPEERREPRAFLNDPPSPPGGGVDFASKKASAGRLPFPPSLERLYETITVDEGPLGGGEGGGRQGFKRRVRGSGSLTGQRRVRVLPPDGRRGGLNNALWSSNGLFEMPPCKSDWIGLDRSP